MKIIFVVIFIISFVLSGIKYIDIYKNNKKYIEENYIQINGEITFVGKTGKGINTKALLIVNYYYDNIKHSGTVTIKLRKT